jgi:hypothetical protein
MNAKDVAQSLLAYFEDADGELIPTPVLTGARMPRTL